MNREQVRLYGITDRHYHAGMSLAEAAEEAIIGGVSILQLREKDLPEDELRKAVIGVRDVCRRYGVPLILDDNVELAAELGCDGVHVGQKDMPAAEARRILGPDKILGVTAKTVEQAKAAEAAGADYLGSGAMFATNTKLDALPMSPETLFSITQSVSIPVAAIGGLDISNIGILRGTGVAGAAVCGGIFNTPDIQAAARALREALSEMNIK